MCGEFVVALAGFGSSGRDVVVTPNNVTRVDVSLSVGDLSETVRRHDPQPERFWRDHQHLRRFRAAGPARPPIRLLTALSWRHA